MRWLVVILAGLAATCGALPRPVATEDPAPPAWTARAAIAFDAAGERGGRAEGFADAAVNRVLTLDDPVRVASVSKLVVAIGVMRLAERGILDLDRPVGDWLGYPVVNPAYPAQVVTLRGLLSHTASLRDHDDRYAIPLGGSLRSVLADPASWDPGHGPAAHRFAYANLNFPVVAAVMEKATGERFDRLMQREVLAPLSIDGCFNWPTCSDAAVARAVALTTPEGAERKDLLRGARPACPVQAAGDGSCDLARWTAGENGSLFAPQGGLRISARGLAKIGRLLLGRGTVDGVRLLSPAGIAAIEAPVWRFDGGNGATDGGFFCTYGLAVQTLASRQAGCRDDATGTARRWVGHAGEAYGLRSGLWIDRARGVGVAYFVTGLGPDDGPGAETAFTRAEAEAFRLAESLAARR
ncbi:serine hydrolase domain-containing protein [Tsuneonella amylolytica]|uniref:serine hydrolase domain-containing protein n=1 Tax=Tsuneonella amylolytica TaxID=2338327 RepID=UPI000EA88A80|nr:serine hydrolase domain-containing protein [Tsuneonella amylolytica]